MLSRQVLSVMKKGLVSAGTSRLIHCSGALSTKVAVVLSGCGVYDGSEIHEASAILVHLSRGGAEVSMFAPDRDQMHVINHTIGETMEPKRNVLVESARIARGKIQSLTSLKVQNFDAVIFPGGFGAAKNLSTFATDGTAMTVDTDVERVLKEFHSASKPIGLCCIAPVLAAKVLPGCEVTIGSDQEGETAGAIEAMGTKHVKKSVDECHVDNKNKIVTTPAFMCDAAMHQIFDGVGTMVTSVLGMSK